MFALCGNVPQRDTRCVLVVLEIITGDTLITEAEGRHGLFSATICTSICKKALLDPKVACHVEGNILRVFGNIVIRPSYPIQRVVTNWRAQEVAIVTGVSFPVALIVFQSDICLVIVLHEVRFTDWNDLQSVASVNFG